MADTEIGTTNPSAHFERIAKRMLAAIHNRIVSIITAVDPLASADEKAVADFKAEVAENLQIYLQIHELEKKVEKVKAWLKHELDKIKEQVEVQKNELEEERLDKEAIQQYTDYLDELERIENDLKTPKLIDECIESIEKLKDKIVEHEELLQVINNSIVVVEGIQYEANSTLTKIDQDIEQITRDISALQALIDSDATNVNADSYLQQIKQALEEQLGILYKIKQGGVEISNEARNMHDELLTERDSVEEALIQLEEKRKAAEAVIKTVALDVAAAEAVDENVSATERLANREFLELRVINAAKEILPICSGPSVAVEMQAPTASALERSAVHGPAVAAATDFVAMQEQGGSIPLATDAVADTPLTFGQKEKDRLKVQQEIHNKLREINGILDKIRADRQKLIKDFVKPGITAEEKKAFVEETLAINSRYNAILDLQRLLKQSILEMESPNPGPSTAGKPIHPAFAGASAASTLKLDDDEDDLQNDGAKRDFGNRNP